ncbi:hypothetical protein HHK36_013118 [Tetracentron sinense]|uniref:Protein PRD1 n=1 Tax=Tetracentron sinense TaxID=13715 RepID=A0A835DGB0_TETSI|nr:hypothetical protein HHK36_013118 [Tetracentron sinense]
MYYRETELQRGGEEEEEEDNSYSYGYAGDVRTPACSQGHRSSLRLETSEGGSICLLCFCNLISNPNSLSVHVSYALSQLSQAISQPTFLLNLRTFHAHLLISPLVQALSSFDDEPIARQTIHLIADLSDSADLSVLSDFVARISDRLSSGALAWSRRQIYTVLILVIGSSRNCEKIRFSFSTLLSMNDIRRTALHCFGVLLNRQTDNPSAHIKDKGALISNLVTGLQLPSEEIRGEVLFVLYKLSVLGHFDALSAFCPKLLHLSLEALMKTQNDDVRLNCVALLTVLAQRGDFRNSIGNDQGSRNAGEADNFMQAAELGIDGTPLIILFAEAIKGPLLSSDSQVQIGTVDLISHCLSWEPSAKHIQVLVEESIADYVFEILRFSGYKDPVVNSCLQVLDLLSMAEQAFRQRLAIGFPTLVPVIRHIAEIPFHPVQTHTLKLVWSCISNCPGVVSRSQVEELVLILTGMFRRHTSGEMGMLPETFAMASSIFVALLKSPSSHGIPDLATSIQETSTNAVLACFYSPQKYPNQLLLHSLHLLKEAYIYSHEENSVDSDKMELRKNIMEVCKSCLLPWLRRIIDETEEEEIILGVLGTFHSILLQEYDLQSRKFAEILVSSSWFSLSFGCLGLYPTEKMKLRVYLMLSSVIDGVLGPNSGQPIRDAAPYLPSDPIDLLFLLRQKSSNNSDLFSCQSAVLLILHTSTFYDESLDSFSPRLADEKQVLASLEQYILVNNSNFLCGISDSVALMQLLHLYSLFRGIAKMSYQIPYSPEAEKLLFHLVVEKEWDLLSLRIHPTALKWLFQQEKISGPLSNQILNFCRFNSSNRTHTLGHGVNSQMIDTRAIAELVAAEDNFGATHLVSLFKHLQEEEGQEDDLTSVVNFMAEILNIFPAASNQLCLHGIDNAIHILYYYSSYSSSPQIFRNSSILIFNILRSVHSETLFDHEAWLPVTIKLLDFFIPTMAADTCNQESLLIIGILSLILHHSTNQALAEASKAILLNTSLVCTINNTIHAACSKGPALADHNEETNTGETLIFVLLLYFFSLRSLHTLLPETLDWQNFLEMSNGAQPLSMICIHCHDLCRLLHFGSPPVKLIASFCLLELLIRVSDQRNSKFDELKCSMGYLKSVLAVLEGLVFYGDIRVAKNCGLCLSMILGWEKLGLGEARVVQDDRWCRLVVEELALSLATPSLASNSVMNHHKPAAYVAVALLRLNKVPEWMRSVFDGSCISGIVENLLAVNVSAEMTQLFRQLMISNYLKAEQITGLNHVFQACRKYVYADRSQEGSREEHLEKVISIPDDLGKACEYLIRIMSSSSIVSGGVQTGTKTLLEEIELYSIAKVTVKAKPKGQKFSSLTMHLQHCILSSSLLFIPVKKTAGSSLDGVGSKRRLQELNWNDQGSWNSGEADNFMQAAELGIDGTPLISLFAEAIKGPLLSSDSQVQIGTVDLISHCWSWEPSAKHIQVLVEESIADYVFEKLRFSGYKDPVANSCLQVLDLLSTAKQAFRQRLAIGFPTLVPVIRHIAEIPFHPVQTHTLKLVWSSISNCPGVVTRSQVEGRVLILTGMFRKHSHGEIGMLPETFAMAPQSL